MANVEFKINYEPQEVQKKYHAIGSGSFVEFMPQLYNGFSMDDKLETEKSIEERTERYARGELTMLEKYILQMDYLIHEAVYGGSRGK